MSDLVSDFLLADLPVSMPVSIRAETSLADPDTCKFIVSRTLHPGGPFFFGNKERAAGSPLGERLFALPGVANVLIAENVVTICKEPIASWSGLKAAIGTAIRTQLLTRAGDIGDACTHHGVSHQHLQAYLNEFVFRFNRRFYPMTAFNSVLGLASHAAAPTYETLYSGEWTHPIA